MTRTLLLQRGVAVAAMALFAHAGSMAQPAMAASGAGMNSTSAGALAAADRKFIDNAAMGGMAEVAFSTTAQQKAGSDQVKQFASKMVEDHGKANAELKQLASSKGVTVPASLDKKHQKVADGLQSRSGKDFDQQYMKTMVADHKKTVALFEKESKSGSNADVKAWATKTLPTLREHMQMAQMTYDGVKGGKVAAMSGSMASPMPKSEGAMQK